MANKKAFDLFVVLLSNKETKAKYNLRGTTLFYPYKGYTQVLQHLISITGVPVCNYYNFRHSHSMVSFGTSL